MAPSARRHSLRRQHKTIRRKIELAEHELAAAQGNNPSEANLVPARAPRRVSPQGPPEPPVGECRSSRWQGPPGSAWRGEWACGFCGFYVQLFGVKNPLGEKNRRKNRKNRENLRLEPQGWCREGTERLDRGEARGGKWTATRLRPAGYGGQAGCQWGSENRNPPVPARPAGELERRKRASKEVAVYE